MSPKLVSQSDLKFSFALFLMDYGVPCQLCIRIFRKSMSTINAAEFFPIYSVPMAILVTRLLCVHVDDIKALATWTVLLESGKCFSKCPFRHVSDSHRFTKKLTLGSSREPLCSIMWDVFWQASSTMWLQINRLVVKPIGYYD